MILDRHAVVLSVLTIVAGTVAGRAAASPHASGQPRSLIVAFGDSITYGWRLPHSATQNYAAQYARLIGGKLVDLAVSGYTCADVARRKLRKMPPGATTVIVYCGTNDIGGFGPFAGSLPNGHYRVAPATRTQLLAAEKAFKNIISTIRQKEPNAQIVALTVRRWQRMTGPEDPRFARDVTAWNAMIRTQHVRVVDIAADPRMYQVAYIQEDLIHPNLAGSTAIADDVLAATRARR